MSYLNSPRSRFAALAGAATAVVLLASTTLLSDTEDPAAPTPTENAAQSSTVGARALSMSNDASPAESMPADSWVNDRVMVRPIDGDIEAVARAAGVAVLRAPGRSGLGAVGVPDGVSPAAFLAELYTDGLILGGGPMGRTQGAGLPQLEAIQFGHLRSYVPDAPPAGLDHVVVAVLDTGVAYEDHVDPDGTEYVQAPSLASSPITAPYDFVNDDVHANDDHQHGTHIASIIASSGDIDGVAPGVGLMPVKVLDENNQGNELDLIEGIYHAVENGADIINLSLSFGADYVPSKPLMVAIAAAKEQGVVLVGAAGNGSLDEVAWPAASPEVLAVGAYCMRGNSAYKHAPYSNRGPSLDISAPGGCLNLDRFLQNGIPDGVIGETIAKGEPTEVGYWLMAGTSQAAAYVSGTVAHMVANGSAVERADRFLQKTAPKWNGHGGYHEGEGSGRLRMRLAVTVAQQDFTYEWRREGRYDLSIMPYLVDNGDGTITPAALVTGLDYQRKRAANVWVHGHLHGEGGGPVSCMLDEAAGGTCTLLGEPVSSTNGQGDPAALAWRFTIGAAVKSDNIAFRPNAMMFASDTLDRLTDEMQSDPELAEASLAFHWADEDLGELGHVAESYVVMDSGSGISTSPFGVIVTPPAIEPLASQAQRAMDGTGISTSPFGITVLTVPPFNPVEGTGISTSPFGFKLVSLEAADIMGGTGISTSPFGFKTIASPTPGDCPDGCEVFDEDPILFGDSVVFAPDGLDFSGSALQLQLDNGGWRTSDGVGAATAISGSSTLGIGATVIGKSVGTGAVELVVE